MMNHFFFLPLVFEERLFGFGVGSATSLKTVPSRISEVSVVANIL